MAGLSHLLLKVALEVEGEPQVEHSWLGGSPLIPQRLEITYTKDAAPEHPRFRIQVDLYGPWVGRGGRISKVNACASWTTGESRAMPKWVLHQILGHKPTWYTEPISTAFEMEDE